MIRAALLTALIVAGGCRTAPLTLPLDGGTASDLQTASSDLGAVDLSYADFGLSSTDMTPLCFDTIQCGPACGGCCKAGEWCGGGACHCGTNAGCGGNLLCASGGPVIIPRTTCGFVCCGDAQHPCPL